MTLSRHLAPVNVFAVLMGFSWYKRARIATAHIQGACNAMSEFAIGTIVGGYQILDIVGQGGMATVYRAHQLSMDRDVALKVLPRHLLRQANSLERFKQEANIIARLEHRAIVPVHDYGEYDGLPYIVMRYMEGGSVAELLLQGALSSQRALHIVEQIAPALDYAHQKGVLHRDLKPSNILLDASGDAYITDFGIARILGENAPSLTTSGVVGTPSYMSPEQAQGHDLDGRSDVYALGVVLFEMLTGQRPFEGETPYSVAVKHVTEPPPSACKLNPNLPPSVERVLYKALEKARERRFQTAAELAQALRQALEHPHDAPQVAPPSMVETEPSLNQALREGAARHGQPLPSAYLSTARPATSARALTPNLQVLPPYVPTGAQPYGRRWGRARRRPTRRVSWATWALMALVVGGLLLAALAGGLYYWLELSPAPSANDNYAATAVYKLTATRQAIETQHAATPTAAPTLSFRTVTSAAPSTVIPTNTPSQLRASLTAERTPVP